MSKAADLARTASASETALSNRNVVINGAMQISQRSASVTGITGDGYHTLDRWRTAVNALGTWTQTQSTDVPTGAGFATSLKMDCTTADGSPAATDQVQVQLRFEGQNLQQFKYGTSSAESITLSFWVKATKTGVNVVSLYQDDGAKQISGTYTIGTSNTWEYKTITFVGNTVNAIVNDNTRGIQCGWYLGAGSNRTSGTLRTTWTAYATADEAVGQVNNGDSTSNDWLITGVQLEVGTVATPFEHRSFGQESQLCKRYFHKVGGSAYCNIATVTNFTNGGMLGPFHHPVEMRASPSVTKSGDWTVLGGDTTVHQTVVSSDSNGKVSEIGFANGSGGTSGRSATLRFSNNANAYLHWIAEL